MVDFLEDRAMVVKLKKQVELLRADKCILQMEAGTLRKRIDKLRDAIYALQDNMPTQIYTGNILREDRDLEAEHKKGFDGLGEVMKALQAMIDKSEGEVADGTIPTVK